MTGIFLIQNRTNIFVMIKHLSRYAKGKNITEENYNHMQQMMDILAKDVHQFYNNLRTGLITLTKTREHNIITPVLKHLDWLPIGTRNDFIIATMVPKSTAWIIS